MIPFQVKHPRRRCDASILYIFHSYSCQCSNVLVSAIIKCNSTLLMKCSTERWWWDESVGWDPWKLIADIVLYYRWVNKFVQPALHYISGQQQRQQHAAHHIFFAFLNITFYCCIHLFWCSIHWNKFPLGMKWNIG
jgi:hypothetical protein